MGAQQHLAVGNGKVGGALLPVHLPSPQSSAPASGGCGTGHIVLVHRADALTIVVATRCRSWRCLNPGCGPYRAGRWLRHLEKLWWSEPIWYSPESRGDRRERSRRKALRARLDANLVAVSRADGSRHVFSDADLGGRSRTFEPVRLAVALPLAKAALLVPGVVRAQGLGAWTLRDSPAGFVRIAHGTEDRLAEAVRGAAREVEGRLGAHVRPWEGGGRWVLPAGLPPEVWVAILRRHLEWA